MKWTAWASSWVVRFTWFIAANSILIVILSSTIAGTPQQFQSFPELIFTRLASSNSHTEYGIEAVHLSHLFQCLQDQSDANQAYREISSMNVMKMEVVVGRWISKWYHRNESNKSIFFFYELINWSSRIKTRWRDCIYKFFANNKFYFYWGFSSSFHCH